MGKEKKMIDKNLRFRDQNQIREDEEEEYRKKIFNIALRKKNREQKLRDQHQRPFDRR